MRDKRLDTLRATLDWYFERYHKTKYDLGTADTFVSRELVGSFAASRRDFERGHGPSLMRVLIACVFFQKRQDQQVLRILRRMAPADVMALTDTSALREQIAESGCECFHSLDALTSDCRLTKDPRTGAGTCQFEGRPCHQKRHTVLMKRYGHFGKVPSSVVLMLREHGAESLSSLRRAIMRRETTPEDRSRALQAALMRSWRVSSKISSMFLSGVANPDLSRVGVPWSDGLAWEQFVVIDSNTDRYLAALGFDCATTYQVRRQYVMELASQLDLRRHGDVKAAYNPRVLQQAMYVFMGRVSRRANPHDCCNRAGACARCRRSLRRLCPFG